MHIKAVELYLGILGVPMKFTQRRRAYRKSLKTHNAAASPAIYPVLIIEHERSTQQLASRTLAVGDTRVASEKVEN
ncbi:unnamed protein product [Pieris brassicae]|uniref:Uncharacterized protein n=1 Tax=Pieris brassicae TaxID=7116 RepID=A0A9P0XHH4_PIEBR|nr:unnamed protein product [Pieris brassicae]